MKYEKLINVDKMEYILREQQKFDNLSEILEKMKFYGNK